MAKSKIKNKKKINLQSISDPARKSFDEYQEKEAKRTPSGKKKSSGKRTPSGEKKSSGKRKMRLIKSLNPIREELSILTSQANALVAELKASGYAEDSRALTEARRTAIRFHTEDQLFTANLPRSKDIGRELARVREFLTDSTSTVEGTQRELYGLTESLFGGQFRADGGYGANPLYVNKQTAERVFEIYRKALETQGGYQRVMGWLRAKYNGLQDYGSENIINAIYDMVTNTSDYAIAAATPGWSSRGGISEDDRIDYWALKASDMISEMIEESKRISDLQQMGIDYGILSSKDKKERLKTQIWRYKMDVIEEAWKDGRK